MKKTLWLAFLFALPASALLLYLNRPEPPRLAVAVVEQGRVEDTVTNTRAGTLKACRRARLSLPVGGQIARLPVREGQQVGKGALLVELWNRDREASLHLARARLQAAQAQARQQCAPVVAAYRELVRLRRLLKEEAASRQQLDRAQAEADARQAACEAAQAELGAARARLEAAQAALEQTRLRAPFAGIVAEINGELNEYVTPSPVGVATLPVVDLVDAGCLYVSAPIDEVDAARLRPGLEVRIHLDAFPDARFPGRLRRIAPYVLERERQARTVEVEAEFDPPPADRTLLPGYTADVEILIAARDPVLRIPTEALREDGTVYVVGPDDRLQRRRVRTGLRNWEWIEIREGLTAGERVLVEAGHEELHPGLKIVPVSRKAGA